MTSTNPAPQIGTYGYFERLYRIEENHWWSLGMRDIAHAMLKKYFGGPRPIKCLDVGCGTGIMMNWISEHFPGSDVAGIDVSAHALDFCRKRGITNVKEATALELPEDNETCDLVVCNDVLQHLPDPDGDLLGFREAFRVLKPGGCFLARTNTRCGLRKNQVSSTPDYRMYGIRELEEKVSGAGFEMLAISHVNMMMSISPIIKRYFTYRNKENYRDHGLRIALPSGPRALLNPLLHANLKIEAALTGRMGIRLPLGNTIIFLARKRG